MGWRPSHDALLADRRSRGRRLGAALVSAPDLISLRERGFCVIGDCIAVIRLADRRGYAVGVQERFRRGGTGRVWRSLAAARRRAAFLADLHRLPVIESI